MPEIRNAGLKKEIVDLFISTPSATYDQALLNSNSDRKWQEKAWNYLDMLFKKDGKERWLEMMGAGLVHPNVLKSAGLDPTMWQGFAFGGGIDRLIMLKYGIDDVRLLYSGDLRLVNQF